MANKQRRIRRTSPIIYVFCEGESEEQYIKWLRVYFRVPVKIITKVLGTQVNEKLLKRYLDTYGYQTSDMIYLLYDGDREDILKKLEDIKLGKVLISIPCIELWYLLHYISFQKEVSTTEVMKILEKYCPHYTKGQLNEQLKNVLKENWGVATQRALSLKEKENPCTDIYKLVRYLEKLG